MAKEAHRSALRLFFTRDLNSNKRQRLLEEIADPLTKLPVKEQLRRLAEIFGWLNSQLLEHQTQEFKDRQDAFTDELVALIAERSGYDAFFQAVWTVMADTAGWNSTGLAALRRFVVSMDRVVGANVERSMRFALNLLERFSRSKISYLGLVAIDPENPTKNREEQEALAVLLVLRDSALAPHDRVTPSKEWMLRMLEHVELDRSVAATWRDIVNLTRATAQGEPNKVIVLDLGDPVVAMQHREMYLSGELTMSMMVTPGTFFALPSEHRRAFLQCAQMERNRNDSLRLRCERLEAWLRKNEEQLDLHAATMLQEIVDRPRRGLRPLGFDHVDVEVSILHSSGIRGIVFRPEGFSLPDTGFEILARRATPHLHVYKGSLNAFNEINPLIIQEGFCLDVPLVRKLLRFVIIDMLHRITVTERKLREKTRGEGTKNGEKGGAKHPVPPHPRRLPEGWKASDEARQAWKETFDTPLPQGCTFVRAHWSSGRMTYDLPTTAFATYGDEDLFDMEMKK